MIYLIGAGPGDPELITVKAVTILARMPIAIYAGSLVNPAILAYLPEGAEIHNSATMTLEEVVAVFQRAHKQGLDVARIHTGDPSIYGAIQEQIDWLDQQAIPYTIIPGVSSFLAAASALKQEFTLPDVSQTVILTRMEGRTAVPELESLERLAGHQSTMVIFLSVQMIDEVVPRLAMGYSLDTPVAVVYKASWPEELILRGTLETIVAQVKEAQISKTALIIVGDVLESAYQRSRLYAADYSHAYRQAKP